MGDTTHIHSHNPQNTYEPARDDEPPNESDPMPTDHLGSRPTMDADPIDNDGEDTSPRVASAPSPLLDPERPATSETSATPDPDMLWSLRSGDGVAPPAAKPKRKAKTTTALDLDAWGLACQSYDTISGKLRKWEPTRGDGRLIAETMSKEGQARIVARFAQAARDPWCLDKRPDVSALCRMGNGIVARLDAAAEQAALDAESRSERAAESGATLTRPSGENRSQGQPAPKQTGSAAWDDMLTTIRGTGGLRLSVGLKGSTLSHEPGEHKRRCQAVADIGGWAKLCEMGEHNRGIIRAQFVAAYDRAGVSA